jgi:hypothetical protein
MPFILNDTELERKQMAHTPLSHAIGDRLDVFEHGSWRPCVLIKLAEYVGKSGPGYYAAYDPPSPNCSSFWVNDRILRERGA